MIVSRWGAVTHKLGCTCRPCKSRRKATAGGGDSAVKKSDAPANDPAVGLLPGRSVSRSEIERLTARASPRGLPRVALAARVHQDGTNRGGRGKEAGDGTGGGVGCVVSRRIATALTLGTVYRFPRRRAPAPRLGDANGLDDAGLPTDPVWRLSAA